MIDICPYCEEGNVIYARVKDEPHVYRYCPECDTIWYDKVDDKSGQNLQNFLESRGYCYPADVEVLETL